MWNLKVSYHTLFKCHRRNITRNTKLQRTQIAKRPIEKIFIPKETNTTNLFKDLLSCCALGYKENIDKIV